MQSFSNLMLTSYEQAAAEKKIRNADGTQKISSDCAEKENLHLPFVLKREESSNIRVHNKRYCCDEE